ncbi:MAG TPA: glycosyltransferase [Methanoregula sp.]|nr:glycosyltransferase [Methanoregula sp.]
MLKYLIITDDNPQSGVLKKARYQVNALNDLGMKSELVIITQEVRKQEESGPVRYVYFEKLAEKSLMSRLWRAKKIRTIISDIITTMDKSDILYYRAFGSLMLSYIPITFFRPFRRCRIISEHNSIEFRELLLEGSYGAVIRNLVLGNFIIGQSDGIVGVTEEITSYWKRRLFYRAIPHVTIPNGFFVTSVPVRKLPSYTPQELHVLFVGNVSRWHGLDRFIQGVAAYHGPVHVNLHIVGDGDELENMKTLTHTLAVTRSVHFHGFLGGPDLDKVFDRYHIAMGSLGIHRNGLKQASALKVREYCSRGIPFMISNDDPDFPATFPYSLPLPPDDTPISMDTVIGFYHAVYAHQSHPGEMREFAEEHLDWSVKMKNIKRFIQTMAA